MANFNRYSSDVMAQVRKLNVPVSVVTALRLAETVYPSHVSPVAAAHMLMVNDEIERFHWSEGDRTANDLYRLFRRNFFIQFGELLFARPLTTETKTSSHEAYKDLQRLYHGRGTTKVNMKYDPVTRAHMNSVLTLLTGGAHGIVDLALNSFAAYLNNEPQVEPVSLLLKAFTDLQEYPKLTRDATLRIMGIAVLSARHSPVSGWDFSERGAHVLNLAMQVMELARYLDTKQHDYFQSYILSICDAAHSKDQRG